MPDLSAGTEEEEVLGREDTPPNAADPKQYAEAKRSRRQQQGEEREWWGQLLDSYLGRRIVWGMLTDARTFEDIFAYGPNGFPDPHQTSFYRGQQQFGQRLHRMLMGYAPDQVLAMHREHDPDVREIARQRRRE